MSETKGLTTRIKEVAKKIEHDDHFRTTVEMLSEIWDLRQEVLQSSGDGISAYSVQRLHKLVLMMQLLDDLVRDKLSIDCMRALE